ncbi:hypothetical protein [Spirosoma oryzicola]|uniref:hypothetical protein n=1 Tax=Spirosoma oryzicola TaxID=2898794 RepID=UPI001E53C805|nr:hypothetical protein [Spirosoma oryzicola]UHG93743.1 hypothetical protein LQ777_24800 [Spirosoma oryzicola]
MYPHSSEQIPLRCTKACCVYFIDNLLKGLIVVQIASDRQYRPVTVFIHNYFSLDGGNTFLFSQRSQIQG